MTDGPYRVGEHNRYRTIQAAWDAVPWGGGGRIVLAHDYDRTREEYPIRLRAERTGSDWRHKAVVLEGQGMGVTVVGERGTPADTLAVVGSEAGQYRAPPTVRDLTLRGGADGNAALRLSGAPFATVANVQFEADGHGLRVAPHPVDDALGCYGVRAGNCRAWGCGGDGFRLESGATPHDASFAGCVATDCAGAGFRVRGASASLAGCTSQLNRSWGVEVRDAPAARIADCYLEGNGRAESFPLEAYGRRADGLVVEGCYLHGATPRSTTHGHDRVRRGLTLHESTAPTVERNAYRGYGEGLLALFDCEDPSVSTATNVSLDGTALWA